ncbi:MAG: DUF4435 domain-containing protein [Muribaculum sp.]|nr:DUF4435 domain-containing protein [Muribaculum sp.]
MATILLPPKLDGKRGKMDFLPGRRTIIIGANGAGKSRFTERLVADAKVPVFRISALNALYQRGDEDSAPGSIDMLYKECMSNSPLMKDNVDTRFERVCSLLIYEELLNLLSYKAKNPGGNPAKLPESKLDRVIKSWQEVFPGNKVLRDRGALIFSRELSDDKYSTVRLSDGEKAVLYYFGAVQFAPKDAVVFVDSPGMFLHPSIMAAIWDKVEMMRPDCAWVYTTHEMEFLTSNSGNQVVWVRFYDASAGAWDYAVLPPGSEMTEEIYMTLVGSRKPVLFIEGDPQRSIDAKLYPLVFTNYTVRSLGSCNKVIEATRTFNDLTDFHHLDSHGIVDRDRRDESEVGYLRDKKIFVPNVAEIENILMLEDVIRAVARRHGHNENRVFDRVKRTILKQFRADLHPQALLHTRHRVKRMMEYRVDGRFPDINKLEEHIRNIVYEIRPRELYENFCRDFNRYVAEGDYQSVLRVYNQKSMLSGSNVASLCGLTNKNAYIEEVINILKDNGPDAERIRKAITKCFGISEASAPAPDMKVIEDD